MVSHALIVQTKHGHQPSAGGDLSLRPVVSYVRAPRSFLLHSQLPNSSEHDASLAGSLPTLIRGTKCSWLGMPGKLALLWSLLAQSYSGTRKQLPRKYLAAVHTHTPPIITQLQTEGQSYAHPSRAWEFQS